jgi:hypothetical protein
MCGIAISFNVRGETEPLDVKGLLVEACLDLLPAAV